MNKLYLSRTDRKLAGLCGGLGQYLRIDPTILRVILVAAACFSVGTIFLIYLLASFIIPKEPENPIMNMNHFHYNPYN
ncbi:PspC domain-containing protein [Paenibacillus sepulcri]|uniref:PspC domain-containing protein n=1 Tax=Paenibacillus sepulcri TaxID=359917 RepID=A0ABS7C572_9BACL|nr:PspC domain-containing protein [Paenibacillus sepulcri]